MRVLNRNDIKLSAGLRTKFWTRSLPEIHTKVQNTVDNWWSPLYFLASSKPHACTGCLFVHHLDNSSSGTAHAHRGLNIVVH